MRAGACVRVYVCVCVAEFWGDCIQHYGSVDVYLLCCVCVSMVCFIMLLWWARLSSNCRIRPLVFLLHILLHRRHDAMFLCVYLRGECPAIYESECDFSGCHFSGCDFSGCDFSGFIEMFLRWRFFNVSV